MQKKFTIAGLGICYGQAQGCEGLLDNLIAGTTIERGAPENASYKAISEALKNYDAHELPVVSNVAFDAELQQSFGLAEARICTDLEQMLEAVNDRALLVVGNKTGYLALLLTQDAVGFAEFSVSGKGRGEADLVKEVLEILTVALEIRYAICLRKAPSVRYRLWDSEDKRQTTIDSNSLKLIFTEPQVLCNVLYESRKYLLPVVFTTAEEAREKLEQLKISAANGLYLAMKGCLEQLSKRTTETNTIVLAAENYQMLVSEIEDILSKSDRLLEKGFVWRTENGSVYICRTCANPQVVFMNPPGGTFDEKIFYKFFCRIYGTLGEASRFSIDKRYLSNREDFFARALFDIVANYIATTLLDGIGIHPDILSGMCQGELSIEYPYMKSKDKSLKDMSRYLALHLRKTVRLAMRGDKKPLEKYLGRKVDGFAKYYLKDDLQKIRKAVEKYDSVFIMVATSTENCFIEGEDAACQMLIKELGCVATKLSEELYIHTPVMEVCREEIRKCILNKQLYLDVENLPFKIYSTHYRTYMTSDSEMLADNLANLFTKEVDYSEVPKALYKDGARVFIDLSPSQLCDTWVRFTVKNIKDAQVVSVYGKEASGMDLFGVCASLLAANVSFEYEKLLSKLSFIDDTEKMTAETRAKEETETLAKKDAEAEILAKKDAEAVILVKKDAEAETFAKEEIDTETLTQKETAAAAEVSKSEEMLAANVQKEKTETVKAMSQNMQNAADFQQYIKRQMAINEEAFRLYMNAQNNLYEQMLGAMAVPAPADAKAGTNVEIKSELKPELKPELHADAKQKQDAGQKPCIWNREQVITMTDSSMSAVLGEAYKEVDQYPVRARMPLPPFLFVSRITEIDAEFGVLRPGRIVSEYDFDEECVFRIGDTRISSCVAAEASHIGIFLMGYMGLDAMSNGTLSFRALDCNQVYLDDKPFSVGDTMRTVFTIHRFAQNGPTTILYYDYETWNGDVLVSRSEASGGFFTQAELASNKGVILPKIPMKKLEPKTLLHYGTTDDVTYTAEQIKAFLQGNPEACFGKPVNFYETYCLPQKYNMQMVERITKIDYNGGKYKRGFVSCEKTITPDLWPFDVHFKNDPVFPGIIMIDGVTQIGSFLVAQTGILSKIKKGELRMITDQHIVTKFRGQVRRGSSTLRYNIHVKEAEMKEDGYYLTMDAEIFNDDVQVIHIESFGLKIIGERID